MSKLWSVLSILCSFSICISSADFQFLWTKNIWTLQALIPSGLLASFAHLGENCFVKVFEESRLILRSELFINSLILQKFRGHLFLFICSSFFGRREVIIMLWEVRWLHCGAVIEIGEATGKAVFVSSVLEMEFLF